MATPNLSHHSAVFLCMSYRNYMFTLAQSPSIRYLKIIRERVEIMFLLMQHSALSTHG